jgi:hypothetical protein
VYNQFSYTDGSTSGSHTPSSTNSFKKNPGFANLTLSGLSGNPLANVKVEVVGPTGKVVSSTFTDEDGYTMYSYKHKGKAQDFIVRLPLLGIQQTVTMKANGYALTVFDTLP